MSLQYKEAFRNRRTRLLAWLIRLFYHHKVLNVPQLGDEPVIFVCNHNCIYGPVVASTFIPAKTSPWVGNSMLSYADAKKETLWGLIHMGWPKWIANPLAAVITKLVITMIDAKEPIPVYRDSRTIITMRDSLNAMQHGRNILIFPENPQSSGWDYFHDDDVAEFHDGFVYLAHMYYRKTGKQLTFYAVYCGKSERTVTFSEAVTYQPQNGIAHERVRVTQDLYEKMKAIRDQGQKSRPSENPINASARNSYYGSIGNLGEAMPSSL